MKPITLRQRVYENIARSLVEFGYTDVTADMIKDCHEAFKEGKSLDDMPHGIVGMFAYKQIDDACKKGMLERKNPDV